MLVIGSSYVMRKIMLEFPTQIIANENLYFKNLINFPTPSLQDYTVSINGSYIVLMPIPETDQQCPKRNKYILKYKF